MLEHEEEEEWRGWQGRFCPRTRPSSSDSKLSRVGGAGGGRSSALTAACKGRLARGCGGLVGLLKCDPRLQRPPLRRPQASELLALHPFLEAARDLEARRWVAQEEAQESADVHHVLATAVRPLQVHTDASRMRGVRVDVGDLKTNLLSRARILHFQILF